jgi:hypothetical protein
MLSRIEWIIVKSRKVINAEKRALRTAGKEAARAVQDGVHVLKVMIFLHSAKDFPSILRLYGIENSSGTE